MLLELIERDTPLRKVAGTRGGEYAGSCPWCGGRDRFRVWPEADKPGYWCRQCGRKGDAIQFLRDRQGLSYREACEHLRLPMRRPRPGRPYPTPPPATTAPSPIWQDRAGILLDQAEASLWRPTGMKALAYLRRRGFTDTTLRQAGVGYHPRDVYDAQERWGMPAGSKTVWIPKGITLPLFLAGDLWKVWVRRPAGEPKYVALAGSRNVLYGVDALLPGHPAMLVEGVLDAPAIRQEAGDLMAGVASGTTSGRTIPSLGKLALANLVLIALDADPSGDEAAAWWLRVLGTRARRWRLLAKDPAEMLQAGLDIRGWVKAGLGREETAYA